MDQPIRFKFKYINSSGKETGFRSEKGSLDDATLKLGQSNVPIEAVTHVIRRFNRLILNLLQKDGTTAPAAIAITRGSARKLQGAINHGTSSRWARLRQEALAGRGESHRFRTRDCPYCDSVIDLSDHADSPQSYCPFCDSVITWRKDGPFEEADLHQCDTCGFYARSRGFTIMYFWCVIVAYGYSYRREYRCGACMRPEAWKMLGGNLLFVLGVPVAVAQLIRAYRRGIGAFISLDRANLLAQRKDVVRAAGIYERILGELGPCAIVRYNQARGLMRIQRWQDAVEQLQAALDDCSNFIPAYRALCACYEQLGDNDSLQALQAEWQPAAEMAEAPDQVKEA